MFTTPKTCRKVNDLTQNRRYSKPNIPVDQDARPKRTLQIEEERHVLASTCRTTNSITRGGTKHPFSGVDYVQDKDETRDCRRTGLMCFVVSNWRSLPFGSTSWKGVREISKRSEGNIENQDRCKGERCIFLLTHPVKVVKGLWGRCEPLNKTDRTPNDPGLP